MEQQLQASILSLFETSKEQRAEFVNELINRLQEGEADPLKAHLQIKAMEDIITQLTSTDEKKNKNVAAAIIYKKLLLEAASQHGKKFQLHNATFEIKEVGTKYDYSMCNDPVIGELLQQQAEVDAKVKERQKFLQTVSEKGMEILSDGGEVVTVYRPSKTSTTSLAVSLK